MSLFSNIKNNKFYYPPIIKVKNNNMNLLHINNVKNNKSKKININFLKNINKIVPITKSNSYNNISNGYKKNDFYLKDQNNNS